MKKDGRAGRSLPPTPNMLVEAPPCDGCVHAKHCATTRDSCHAFMRYAELRTYTAQQIGRGLKINFGGIEYAAS